jgi:hypothetical protein
MRIIGHIDHPEWKVTVFKMDNRLSVKLENGLYEQIYKFRAGEAVETLEDVRAMLDEEFAREAGEVFARMHHIRLSAGSRRSAPEGEEHFDEII